MTNLRLRSEILEQIRNYRAVNLVLWEGLFALACLDGKLEEHDKVNVLETTLEHSEAQAKLLIGLIAADDHIIADFLEELVSTDAG